MANQQTAEQWQAAAANLENQRDQLENESDTLSDLNLRLMREATAKRQELNSLPGGSPQRAQLNQEIRAINEQITANEVKQGEIANQLSSLNVQINSAQQSVVKAEQGVPTANAVPPPATAQPNTDATSAPPQPALVSPDVSPQPVPAGEDPYVDLQDEGENITQFEGTVDQPEPVLAGDDPYVDEGPGLTEFTEDGEIRWEDPNDFGALDSPYQDEEGLVEFERADPDLTEPEGVDPEEDPYAQLVEDTEAEGGLVEFTENGPVGTASADLQQAALARARAQQVLRDQQRQANNGDWRVKLRLAPGSDYLYRANDGLGGQSGILKPLVVTDGVVFPYTPQIQTNYKANYNSYDLTHSNYRGYFYQGSSVDEINLTATFTAQDTYEAEYLLAVIHFFRSITKMFYGKDGNAGTPPPLVFLQGLGEYQFNLHPCVVSSFTYNLPNDVDYIRARSPNQANLPAGLLNRRQRETVTTNPFQAAWKRLETVGVKKGGLNQTPAPAALGTKSPTYVPTKIDIQLVLLPVQSRSQVSKNFSLEQYANGNLLKGGFW